MKFSRKKNTYGWIYFVPEHVDKVEFVNAINAAHPREQLEPVNVVHGYSAVDGGRYGIGRRFWKKKDSTEKNIVKMSFVLPGPFRKHK